MPTNLQDCPDSQTLTDFLLGKLPTEVIEDCRQHLSDCDPCVETIRGLKVDGDTLNELSRDAWIASVQANGQQTESRVIDELMNRMEGLSGLAKLTRASQSNVTEDRAAEVQRLLSPAVVEQDLGTLGKYRICQLLGAGSTGVVYRAIDQDLERTVALKILRPSLGEMARERFVAEAKATAMLQHPNVVQIYEVGIEGPLAFISMMWEPGRTLEQVLETEENLPIERVKELGIKLADALAHAHHRGLIHRDVKPANVWIPDESGVAACKILDFGLVRITDEDPQLTCTGMIAGTPCYMSPEQSRGQQLDGRSDLFSLGCVLYQSLTGRLPFRSDNALSTLQSIQRDQPTAPIELDPSIPSDVSELVMCLLEKSPSRRPPNATAAGAALTSPRDQWPFDVTLSPPLKTKPEIKKSSSLWRSVAILLVGLGLGVMGLMFGPQITRIVTNRGIIEIKSNVDDVKIEVLQNGEQIRVVDLATEQSINITSGSYEIRPLGDQNSIQIENNALTLTRGEKEIVTITRIPNSSLGGAKSQFAASNLDAGATRKPSDPYQLDSGDVLGIFIEGVVGEHGSNPPVNFPPPESGLPPSTGYPILIDEDGAISLPLIQPIIARGKTLSETKKLIIAAYEDGEEPLLRKGQTRYIISMMRKRDYVPPKSSISLRNKIFDLRIDLNQNKELFGAGSRIVRTLEGELKILEDELARQSSFTNSTNALDSMGNVSPPFNATSDKPTSSSDATIRLDQLKSTYEKQLELFRAERIDESALHEAESHLLEFQIKEGNLGWVQEVESMKHLLKIRESQYELAVLAMEAPPRADDNQPDKRAESSKAMDKARLKLAAARRQLRSLEQEHQQASTLPVYNGKTYEECLEVARSERDLTKLLPAMKGLANLANEIEHEETAEAIMQIIRRGSPLASDEILKEFRAFKSDYYQSMSFSQWNRLVCKEIGIGNPTSIRSLASDRKVISIFFNRADSSHTKIDPFVQNVVDAIADRYANESTDKVTSSLVYFLAEYDKQFDCRLADCSSLKGIVASVYKNGSFFWQYGVLVAKICPETKGFSKQLQTNLETASSNASGNSGLVSNQYFYILLKAVNCLPTEQAKPLLPVTFEGWKRVDSKEFPSTDAAEFFSRFPKQSAQYLPEFERRLRYIRKGSDEMKAYSDLIKLIKSSSE